MEVLLVIRGPERYGEATSRSQATFSLTYITSVIQHLIFTSYSPPIHLLVTSCLPPVHLTRIPVDCGRKPDRLLEIYTERIKTLFISYIWI